MSTFAGTTGVGAVAAQMDRLTTSDVLWTDRVISPIDALLAKSGIQGATTPPSRFITDLNATTAESIKAWLHPTTQSPSTTLTLGSRGTGVAFWQRELDAWLARTHQTRLTPDGSFGASTQAATATLQRAQGLTPDGIVGPQTRRALAAALTASSRGSAPR